MEFKVCNFIKMTLQYNILIFCLKNHSFSWSQALQLPVLDLCKGKDDLQLDAMAKLYVEELKIASAAAKGEWVGKDGEGDHVGK